MKNKEYLHICGGAIKLRSIDQYYLKHDYESNRVNTIVATNGHFVKYEGDLTRVIANAIKDLDEPETERTIVKGFSQS